MDLLDVPYDITVDGRNAAPLLTGQARSWEDICFLRSTPNNPWLAVTTHQYKLVYSSIETPWFIDVNHDPQERINLFEQPVHQDRIRELTQKLREYCLKHNDPYARIPRIHASISEVLDGASEEARE